MGRFSLRYFKEWWSCFFRVIFSVVLLSVIVSVIYGFIVWIKSITNLVPLSQLIITGQRAYTTNNDIYQSVLKSGLIGTFMTQDVRCIQRQIKRFPWIKQVSVRKQWPDKIQVHIIEYIPVACWNNIYMITKEGVVFTIPEWRVNRKLFPLLLGPLGKEKEVLINYCMFNEVIQSHMLTIESINMSYRNSWYITLSNGLKLILGRENNVVRLERFLKVYPIFLKRYVDTNDGCISYIDLRYESGFSVKRCQSFNIKIH